MTAVACTSPRCRRMTKDTTGLCHDHRSPRSFASASPSLFPIPVPAGRKPVHRRVNNPDGSVRSTTTVGGVLHCEDGPAETVFGNRGEATRRWFFHGMQVRTDGPVETETVRFGNTEERWRTKELAEGWHREDGPAVVASARSGEWNRREWWRDGVRHRDGDEPAVIRIYPSGRPMSDEWFVSGKHHRENGPAHVFYHERDEGRVDRYYRHGKLHRIDGPASEQINAGGTDSWWIEGVKYESRERAFDVLSRKSGKVITRALAGSSFEPLLDEGHRPAAIAGALAAGVRTPEGVREVISGAPAEWVRSYEEARS